MFKLLVKPVDGEGIIDSVVMSEAKTIQKDF